MVYGGIDRCPQSRPSSQRAATIGDASIMTNNPKYAVAKKFINKGRAEFLEFKGNLKDILRFHKFKLHTILFDDKLHPAVRNEQFMICSD
mmetsp:Transcript_8991/g.19588  ORF Transcript_8991/g.19588 Transcript_8991/m.19588 type:complete len:90 (-) Transcript_8991:2298-2567(-)